VTAHHQGRTHSSGGGVTGHVDQRVNLRTQQIRSSRAAAVGNRRTELTREELARRTHRPGPVPVAFIPHGLDVPRALSATAHMRTLPFHTLLQPFCTR